MYVRWLSLLALFLSGNGVQAQTLPTVTDANWPAFRTQVEELLKHLTALKAPLPPDTNKALSKFIGQQKPDDPEAASLAVQKLLDAHCLLGVNINPESRVKAQRGSLRAELILDQTTYVLVKVHNDGGVTHRLGVDSPQLHRPKEKDLDRWLEVAVLNDKPYANRLSGDRVEYRVLKLTARQAGKREATLAFDVGQGTQDLGFRAEVPLLFLVKRGK